MSERQLYRNKQLAQWKEGKLMGILYNSSWGFSGIYLQDHMLEFMSEFDEGWIEKENEADIRTDQYLIKAILDHPDKFMVKKRTRTKKGEYTMRREFRVAFVDPIVIKAKAWRINSYDGSESVDVVPECIALWKIRQATQDPEILKLATLKEKKYWWCGHLAE